MKALGLFFFLVVSVPAKETTPALAIASLTDPAKLATLKGERAANPRLQKCLYWLAYAEEQGSKPEAVNRAKSDKITDRARVFARELYDAGLLSEEGLRAVEQGSNVPQGLKP